MKQKRGILYLSCYRNLKRNCLFNNHIKKEVALVKLGVHFLVPKPQRPLVIKEMEKLGMLKIEDPYLILIPIKEEEIVYNEQKTQDLNSSIYKNNRRNCVKHGKTN